MKLPVLGMVVAMAEAKAATLPVVPRLELTDAQRALRDRLLFRSEVKRAVRENGFTAATAHLGDDVFERARAEIRRKRGVLLPASIGSECGKTPAYSETLARKRSSAASAAPAADEIAKREVREERECCERASLSAQLRLLATAETVLRRYIAAAVPGLFSWRVIADAQGFVLTWSLEAEGAENLGRSVSAFTMAELAARVAKIDWSHERLACSPRVEGVGVQVDSQCAGSAGREAPPRIEGATCRDSCSEGARGSEDRGARVAQCAPSKQPDAGPRCASRAKRVKGAKTISGVSKAARARARRGGCLTLLYK